MQYLQKMTTQYDEKEDRLRLSGELGPDAQVLLWITARLLNRLLPPLLKWLDKQSGVDVRPELYQSLAQAAAVRGLEPQAPVQATASSRKWLVQAVDITPQQDQVQLVFRGANADEQAAVLLPARPLRQWLGILFDQYRRAEWRLDIWPQWMHEARQTPSEHRTTVLH